MVVKLKATALCIEIQSGSNKGFKQGVTLRTLEPSNLHTRVYCQEHRSSHVHYTHCCLSSG